MEFLTHILKGRRERPALLFLHGFMGRGEDWLPVIESFADDYFCIAPDLPGHGVIGSRSIDEELSFSSISGEIDHLMRSLEIEEVALVGYSLGARLALHLAVRYPKLVKSLVIESGTPGIQETKLRETRIEREAKWAKAAETDFERFLRDWYSLPLFSSLSEQQCAAMIKSRLRNQPPWMAKVLRELGQGAQRSLWNKLEMIEQPTLLLAGERDGFYREILSKMAQLIPNASHQLISGAGHLIHLEKKDEFVQSLRYFLEKLQ